MKRNKVFLRLVILLLVFITGIGQTYSREFFNKKNDLLLAHYDLRPDEDDIHSAVALACMLRHEDMLGVNFYVVAGTYGIQKGTFLHTCMPEFMTNLFGEQNATWTDAHNDWRGSYKRVSEKIIETFNNGGKVFIAEGGQSDFTYDLVQNLLKEGVSAQVIKSKLIVVQHSYRNEMDDMADQFKLKWVKQNTYYEHIDDGNRGDNNTPGYMSDNGVYMKQALAAANPNKVAQSFWSQAKDICDNFESTYENPHIGCGGVDFSDHSEIWWIFNQGELTKTIEDFWKRYVINTEGVVVRPALDVAPKTLGMKDYTEWTPLLDTKLSNWDNYLSYRFKPGYKGEQPVDRKGKAIEPIGMNSDSFNVFSAKEVNGETVLRISGEIYGGLISKKEYQNYHLRLKVKWGNKKWPPRENLGYDSGLLYHSIGEPGAEYWRSWMLSQEFQIIQGGMGDYWCQASSAIDIISYIPKNGKTAIANHFKEFQPFSRESEYGFHCLRSVDAELPCGQWNTLDLICFEDKAYHIVNGVLVMILQNSRYNKNGKPIELTSGKIQLQSEAAEVFYKNIEIRSIEAIPTDLLIE